MTSDAVAAPSDVRRRRRRWFMLAAFALGLVVSLVLGEIIVRLADVTAEPRRHFSPGIYDPDPTLGWVLVKDYRGVHMEYDFEAPTTTNARGYRGPDWDAERAKAPIRILALGDSCTFGRGVADGETWPAQLEAKLRAAGREAAVFNSGVPGYDTKQELEVLRRLEGVVHPTHVILAWLPNDVIERSVESIKKLQIIDHHLVYDVEKYRAWKRHIEHRGVHGSELYRFATVKSKQLTAALGFRGHRYGRLELSPETLRYSQDDVLKIQAETQRLGAKLLLVLFPREEELEPGVPQEHHELMAAFAKEHGIPVLNLPQEMQEHPREGRYLSRDAVHFTPAGYSEIADAIVKALPLP